MTEKQLIQGCIAEKSNYQRALFQQYAGKMLTVCRRYARHDQEAEDMLQDAFIKVFNNIQKFRQEGSFEGWIRRIVVNTALKSISKSSFKKEKIGIERMPDSSEEPTVLAQLGEEELLRIIRNLPDGYRVVFNLYAIEGFSHREIAKELNIMESTSRSQLVKARRMLQKQVLQREQIKIA